MDAIYDKVYNGYMELCRTTQKESSFIQEESSLCAFLNFVKGHGYEEINESVVVGFIKHCKILGNRPNTIKRKVGVVRRYLEYLGAHSNIDVQNMLQVCKKVKGEMRIQPQVTMKQIEILIENARGIQYKALIAIQAYMGLRVSEVLKLNKSDFDKDKTHCIIRSPKNGNERRVVVSGSMLHDILDSLFSKTQGNALFSNVKENTYKVYLGRLSDRMGFHATTHALRRCYATYSQEKHIPLPALQHQLGHSSLAVTSRYVSMTPAMEEELESLFKK